MARGVAEGLIRGMDQVANTIMQVGLAKAKLKQQREQFDLEKKTTKANLELMKKKGAQIDMEMDLYENKAKFMEALFDTKESKLNVAEKRAKDAGRNLDSFGKGFSFGNMQVDIPKVMGDLSGIPMEEVPRKERFRRDVESAMEGKKKWGALEEEYKAEGGKLEDIKEARIRAKSREWVDKPIDKPPLKRTNFLNLIERARGDVTGYGIDDATARWLGNISTYGDLLEIDRNTKKFQNMGVDVKQIVDYYKEEFLDLAEAGLLK